MTIAVGIDCPDGVVLAADTLETTDYIKGDEHKIAVASKPPKSSTIGLCAIAGAGDAGYIDACTRGIAQIFTDHGTASIGDLRVLFEKYMIQFHRDHVIPFAPYPEDERPGLDMLFGILRKDRVAILVSDRSTVRQPLRPFVALGFGGDFATMMIRRLFPLHVKPTVEQAKVLAAYIVFHTKEHVESCGKYTTIIALHKNHPTAAEYTMSKAIKRFEQEFREWAKEERQLMWPKIAGLARPSNP